MIRQLLWKKKGTKMRGLLEYSPKTCHPWFFTVLIFVAVVILNSGRPGWVWGEPPDTPNLNPWVTNGAVNSIASEGGITYIGGTFTHVGPYTGNGVPISEATGLVLPSYLRVNGAINIVIPDGTGGWYIGGDFTSVGGVERNRIAHILPDNSLDIYWNPSADGRVDTLALGGEMVYVGGDFTTIGGHARTSIAALDAMTGEATPWNPNSNGTVYTLGVSGDTVYAGGTFTTIGGQSRTSIGALDAVTGEATPWNPNSNGTHGIHPGGEWGYGLRRRNLHDDRGTDENLHRCPRCSNRASHPLEPRRRRQG
jgi:hypothetical protein